MPTWRDIREAANLRALDNLGELTSAAVQSQYSASPRLLRLMRGSQEGLDLWPDADLIYDRVVNIHTAVGWGLDNWGRILGMGRTIEDEHGNALTLDDGHYRLLLLYKALANISAADAATLNRLLATLVDTGVAGFPRAAYVLEVDVMVIRWVFEDFLDAVQRAVFRAAGTLARGGGVGWELYALNPDAVFGCDGSGMHPFNQRPFAPDDALVAGR